MKQQTVWACLTRAGIIAKDKTDGMLLSADTEDNLLLELPYHCLVGEGSKQLLRHKRWRIAKVRLTIEEIKS